MRIINTFTIESKYCFCPDSKQGDTMENNDEVYIEENRAGLSIL